MGRLIFHVLHYLIATGVTLSLLLFFLAENGRANSFATYLVALAVLAVMVFPSSRKWLNELPRSIFFILVCLLQYLALSAWWSEAGSLELVLRFQGYAALILLFVLGLSISARQYDQFLMTLSALTLAAAGVSAAYSVYLHFALPEYQPLPEPRLYGLGRLSNPVISAASYGFASMLGLWLLIRLQTISQRLALLGVLCLLVFAILLSGTRTVWLALAVGIGTGAAFWRRDRALLVFTTVFFTAGFLGLMVIGWEDVARRGFSFRPEIWSEFFLRSLAAHPVLGAGSGASSYWQTPELTFKHPHSVFVSIFFFGGILGLALFLCLLFACFRQLLQAPHGDVKILAAMLLSYGTVFGIFDGDNILSKVDYLWWLIWMPIGVCLCLRNQIRS